MGVDRRVPAVADTHADGDAQTCTAGQGERPAEAQVPKTLKVAADNTVEVAASAPVNQDVPSQETDAQAQHQHQDEVEIEVYVPGLEDSDLEDSDLWTILQDLVLSIGLPDDMTALNEDEWYLEQMTRAVDALSQPVLIHRLSPGASTVVDDSSKDVQEDQTSGEE